MSLCISLSPRLCVSATLGLQGSAALEPWAGLGLRVAYGLDLSLGFRMRIGVWLQVECHVETSADSGRGAICWIS